MSNALVLMKAMPPTKGHERLIEFAMSFCEEGWVLMDTAPDEPLQQQRWQWLAHQVINGRGWEADWLTIDDQNPASDGFWERWKSRIDEYDNFDYVIGSEDYCAKVAEVIGARYIPYDPKRELVSARATDVRGNLQGNFAEVSESFQHNLRRTITVFGAESTGKTTLSKTLASLLQGEWLFEWARPYLEGTGQDVVDLTAMHEIWHGQFAAEENAEKFAVDKPFIVRDTDLYSTIGYWEQPHWQSDLGPVPENLIQDAKHHQADLYVITQSNIPFEKDPLRYGGDHRESPDKYWIDVAEKYGLPHIVLTSNDRSDRVLEASAAAVEIFNKKNSIYYDRKLVS
ncbi:MAG TPA: AAA family ATPase [Dongiaceae bacterium]|jgi:NadR type nicotinamide-nucleotide adenylyltransferase|nr:AAA family ATPase [Dongiaceae bacterium]